MNRVTCNDDSLCVDPTNSRFTCQLDDLNSPMVCGLDLEKKKATSRDSTQMPVKMVVSEVSILARFEITFSDPIDFLILTNTTKSASNTT